MNEDMKVFIDFFPKPQEPNPFVFKSKEEYFNTCKALAKLANARIEWEKMTVQNITPSEVDIQQWDSIYNEYEESMKQGLKDKFKNTL